MAPVFALSIHAQYRCGHSGACCTAGWAIPVEPHKQPLLGGALLVPRDDGACRYFDRPTRLCRVQRDHGEPALPESCRHFPRVTLIDDRGIHVTLSHFCPTAARSLFAGGPPSIVESPPAFPADREYDGLDARGAWPPPVPEALLFDSESFTAWERFVVASFAAGTTDLALARIAGAAERLRAWTPAEGPMIDTVAGFESAGTADPVALGRYDAIREHAGRIVMGAIPDGLKPGETGRGDGPQCVSDDPVIRRYLAARAFASWTAYQGRGLRTLVAELVLARALVASLAATRTLIEAIREADRRLVHLCDRSSLVRALGTVERD